MRELLRSLPVFVGLPADLDVTSLPSEPTVLFERWLREAIDEGVYWPLQARQGRIRGPVVAGPPEPSAAGFLARESSARAIALTGKESQPLSDRATCLRAVQASQATLVDEPDRVPTSAQVYAVDAHVIEFSQGDRDRVHTRVQYTRDGREWSHHLLWR